MKKIAFYLFAVIALASCKGDDGRDGFGANTINRKITINKNQWFLEGEPDALGSYYYATVRIPELTADALYGIKLAYIEPIDGVQVGLPYVLHKGDVVNGVEYLWTQTYDCEYENGYVTFILTYSDFYTWQVPDTEVFNILLSW